MNSLDLLPNELKNIIYSNLIIIDKVMFSRINKFFYENYKCDKNQDIYDLFKPYLSHDIANIDLLQFGKENELKLEHIEIDRFYFNIFTCLCPTKFILKICHIRNEQLQFSDHFESEKLILNILKEFVLNNITPHIVIPLLYLKTNINLYYQLTGECINTNYGYHSNFRYFKSEINNYKNEVFISVQECYKNLLHCLQENILSENQWTILLFQLLYTLAVIQKKYKTFRHNNLKLNNIAIIKTKRTNIEYEFNETKFIFNKVNFRIMINNFNLASLHDTVKNNITFNPLMQEKGIGYKENKYIDIHYFLSILTRADFYKTIKGGLSPMITQFIDRIIPPELKKFRCDVEEYTTPAKIIFDDPLFAPFKI